MRRTQSWQLWPLCLGQPCSCWVTERFVLIIAACKNITKTNVEKQQQQQQLTHTHKLELKAQSWEKAKQKEKRRKRRPKTAFVSLLIAARNIYINIKIEGTQGRRLKLRERNIRYPVKYICFLSSLYNTEVQRSLCSCTCSSWIYPTPLMNAGYVNIYYAQQSGLR